MAIELLKPPPLLPGAGDLPPLMPGDHLDRATFHDRYEAMPEGLKWELLRGFVFMSAVYFATPIN